MECWQETGTIAGALQYAIRYGYKVSRRDIITAKLRDNRETESIKARIARLFA